MYYSLASVKCQCFYVFIRSCCYDRILLTSPIKFKFRKNLCGLSAKASICLKKFPGECGIRAIAR
jgi:hypothetical protein